MEGRNSSFDKREIAKRRVIEMYKELEGFLKNAAYGTDLEIELEESNPGFINHIQTRIHDMNECDHGIVIAGETSAGKSTLINKILQKNIFQGHTEESTSTICKIRNLEGVTIIAKCNDGSTRSMDLSKDCEMSTESGVEMLRKTLTALTDMVVSAGSVNFEYVDVGFPIPFLKGNSILVDTPGIGGSGEVTQKLIDYLPSAISFIFVINVGSAGGLQTDRLPVVLKALIDMQIKNEMPCFDPQDVIFITNKWDTIDSQYDVEKEKEDLWKKINMVLKKQWSHVKEGNVFRMNITRVYTKRDNGNTSTEEFEKFLNVLLANVEKAKNIRVERHLGFLKDLLKNVSKGLNARLQLKNRSVKEQQELAETQLQLLRVLKVECDKKYKSVLKNIDKAIEEVTEECYQNMQTDQGREKILNPGNKDDIMDVPWTKSLVDEIQNRIALYIETFLKQPHVTKIFEDIKHGNVTFYKDTAKRISTMECHWTNVHGNKTDASVSNEENDLPLFLEIPLFAVGIVLAGIVAVVALILSPILVPLFFLFYSAEKQKQVKQEFINKTYSTYMLSIRGQIHDHLHGSCGDALKLLSDTMFKRSLPSRIHHLEKIIENLKMSRGEILKNMESFKDLAIKIESMKMSALEI